MAQARAMTRSDLDQKGFVQQPDGSYARSKTRRLWCPETNQYYEDQTHRPLQDPKPEPALCHDPLGPAPGKEKGKGRISVVIKSFRSKLLDPDNLCGGAKFLIDALRYEQYIPDDSPDHISLTVEQVKVGKGQERTEIEIEMI